MRLPHSPARRRYTMIEILTVMAIIVTMAAMLAASAGPIRKYIKNKRTIAQLKMIELVLDQYNADQGYFPQCGSKLADNSLWTTLLKPNGAPYMDPDGAGFQKNGSYGYVDPFGKPFHYNAINPSHNAEKFDLWSEGYDQKDGTGDDLGNWMALN